MCSTRKSLSYNTHCGKKERKEGVYQQEEHCLPWNVVHWVGRRRVWPWQSWCLHIAHALIAAYRSDPSRCQLGTAAFRSRNDGALSFHIQPPLYDTYRRKTSRNSAHSWVQLWGEAHTLAETWGFIERYSTATLVLYICLLEAQSSYEANDAEPFPGVWHRKSPALYNTALPH